MKLTQSSHASSALTNNSFKSFFLENRCQKDCISWESRPKETRATDAEKSVKVLKKTHGQGGHQPVTWHGNPPDRQPEGQMTRNGPREFGSAPRAEIRHEGSKCPPLRSTVQGKRKEKREDIPGCTHTTQGGTGVPRTSPSVPQTVTDESASRQDPRVTDRKD